MSAACSTATMSLKATVLKISVERLSGVAPNRFSTRFSRSITISTAAKMPSCISAIASMPGVR